MVWGEDVMIDIICIVDKEWVFNILARLAMEKIKLIFSI